MMNYQSSWKMPKDSAAVATTTCTHKKITHITITTTCSNGNGSFPSSRINHTPKSLNRNKYNELAQSKILVSNAIKKRFSKDRKRPLWGKFLFNSKKFTSIILLNVIAIVYASDITIIKDVESFLHPAYFAAVRFTLSTIPFLPFIFRARNDVQTRISGLELGFWISLGYLTEALGLLTSDAGRASFISLFTVIVIPLLESMLGAIVPARTWFGILMSVLGISMLECSGSTPCIGDLFNFLSAIFFGIHTLRTEHISRTTRKEDYLALLGYEIGFVAVLSTLWCVMGPNFDGNQDSEGIAWSWALFLDWFNAFPWIPALYTGVFSTGLCLWGEIAAMRDVSALETAVIYGLEPLWGAGFAWFLLGERWGIDGWIGAALILGGSLTVQMFGVSSIEAGGSSKNGKGGEMTGASEHKERKKTLTTSPVMVRSNVTDIVKK